MEGCVRTPVHRLVRPTAVEDVKADVTMDARTDVMGHAIAHVQVDVKTAAAVTNILNL